MQSQPINSEFLFKFIEMERNRLVAIDMTRGGGLAKVAGWPGNVSQQDIIIFHGDSSLINFGNVPCGRSITAREWLTMKNLIITMVISFTTHSLSLAREPKMGGPVKIEQAVKQLERGVQLLDVRTKEEWNNGHLKDATLITVTEEGFLEKAKATLDVKKEVLIYCRSGNRSVTAAKQLRAAGFTVYELEGGITGWRAGGNTVVK